MPMTAFPPNAADFLISLSMAACLAVSSFYSNIPDCTPKKSANEEVNSERNPVPRTTSPATIPS